MINPSYYFASLGGLLFCLVFRLWRVLLLPFPFAIALTGATTASNAIAIAVMKFLIFKFFPNRIAPLRCPSDGGLLFTNGN